MTSYNLIKSIDINVVTKFKVQEFYSGHNYNTPARTAVWNLLATKFGGWECVGNRYEKYGKQGLYCRGLRDTLRDLIDPKDLSEIAFERYGAKKELSLEEKENKVLKTLGGSLSNQFRNKFETIYTLYNGSKVFKEEFKELDKTFKTSAPTTNTGISKSKCLEVATSVSKLLETLTEEERVFVLGVI